MKRFLAAALLAVGVACATPTAASAYANLNGCYLHSSLVDTPALYLDQFEGRAGIDCPTTFWGPQTKHLQFWTATWQLLPNGWQEIGWTFVNSGEHYASAIWTWGPKIRLTCGRWYRQQTRGSVDGVQATLDGDGYQGLPSGCV